MIVIFIQVLETQVKKDGKGKKSIEYLIHFQVQNFYFHSFSLQRLKNGYLGLEFILGPLCCRELYSSRYTGTQASTERTCRCCSHHTVKYLLYLFALSICIPSKQFNLYYRKENRRTTKQRIGALRGADPKFRTDSESSSVEEGDSGTRSSFEEDSTECENSSEPIDSQDPAANENTIVVFNIPDSIKQLLEEDGIKIKSRKKVCINQLVISQLYCFIVLISKIFLQLLKLPCHVSVTTILDGFLRHYASTLTSKNSEKTRVSQRTNSTSSNTSSNAGDSATIATQLTLCKEVIDGLRK